MSHRNEPARERHRKLLKQNYSLSSLPLDDKRGLRLTLENHFGWHVLQKCHVGDGSPQVIQFHEKPNKKGNEFQKVTYVMYVKGKEEGIGVERPEKETQTGSKSSTGPQNVSFEEPTKPLSPEQKDQMKWMSRIAMEQPPPLGTTAVFEPYGPNALRNISPYIDLALPTDKVTRPYGAAPTRDSDKDTTRPPKVTFDDTPKKKDRDMSGDGLGDEPRDRDDSPGRKKKKFIREFYYKKGKRDSSPMDDKIGAARDEMKDIDGQAVKGASKKAEDKRNLPKKWQLRAGAEHFESDLEMVGNYMEYTDNYYMNKQLEAENEQATTKKGGAEGEMSFDSHSDTDDFLYFLQNRPRRTADTR